MGKVIKFPAGSLCEPVPQDQHIIRVVIQDAAKEQTNLGLKMLGGAVFLASFMISFIIVFSFLG